jgi:hypothetical protein
MKAAAHWNTSDRSDLRTNRLLDFYQHISSVRYQYHMHHQGSDSTAHQYYLTEQQPVYHGSLEQLEYRH